MKSETSKLPVLEKIGYSLGDAGANFVFQTMILFQLNFYTDTVGIAAAIAGYLAINIAAACAGFEFGIQPMLYHEVSGHALYCPYDLNVALPAMLGGHLLVFGWVEALVTALVLRYLQKQAPELLYDGRT